MPSFVCDLSKILSCGQRPIRKLNGVPGGTLCTRTCLTPRSDPMLFSHECDSAKPIPAVRVGEITLHASPIA